MRPYARKRRHVASFVRFVAVFGETRVERRTGAENVTLTSNGTCWRAADQSDFKTEPLIRGGWGTRPL